MFPMAEFLRGQDDQFSYPIIVHILLDPLSDMCHNNTADRLIEYSQESSTESSPEHAIRSG